MRIIVFMFVIMVTHAVRAETCIPTSFNVTYSCNGGTLAGTLPDDTLADYNKNFTPTVVTASMCTPPADHVYAGWAILVDGKEVAYQTGTDSKTFVYYYTSDIEIGPHWVPIASPVAMAANLGVGQRSSTYDATAKTWTVNFGYGAVSGVAKCSTVLPENSARGEYTGWIASDQDAIESGADSGAYCYCKMTKPDVPGSPWVYFYGNKYAPDSCTSDCARYCVEYILPNAVSRASVFAAAIAEAANNN